MVNQIDTLATTTEIDPLSRSKISGEALSKSNTYKSPAHVDLPTESKDDLACTSQIDSNKGIKRVGETSQNRLQKGKPNFLPAKNTTNKATTKL